MSYKSLLLATAIIVSMALLAWLFTRIKFPRPLEWLGRLSKAGNTPDTLKALDKRLRALNIPISTEIFIAGRLALTAILSLSGVLFLAVNIAKGLMLFVMAILIWRLPFRLLDLLDKRRKEDLRKGFTFMVSQVRIYAKAADMYQALKIVPYAIQGPMGKELRLLSADLEMSPMAEALDSFAKRCGLKEAQDFAQIVLLGIKIGADFDTEKILSNFAKVLQKRRVGEIKRWIKLQPILMTLLPAALLWIFMLMFLTPLYAEIISSLKAV
ncbi:MAG: hypothetical protein A4E53_00332 [Pelotomaculum sp. PtaB.Bin104]|nr:MAG: hypothetical protein A4E53_00332 [Pelotomaculum sp. PtaB.Bin104]